MPTSTPQLPLTRAVLRSDAPPAASSLSPTAAAFTPAAAQTLGAAATLPHAGLCEAYSRRPESRNLVGLIPRGSVTLHNKDTAEGLRHEAGDVPATQGERARCDSAPFRKLRTTTYYSTVLTTVNSSSFFLAPYK